MRMLDGEISVNIEPFPKATTTSIFASTMKHTNKCIDKKFCNKLKPDKNACTLLQHIRDDCPLSCKICAPCEDKKNCNLIPNIRKYCSYDPEAVKMCPQSCGICPNQNVELGNFCITLNYM